MPEICEIVITSQYLISKLKNRYITGIHIVAGKYTKKKITRKRIN